MGGMKLGERPTEITLDDFIVLFANHRTFPVSNEDIERAFQVLGMLNEENEVFIPREDFLTDLTTKGTFSNI